jgi:hypothetical protein
MPLKPSIYSNIDQRPYIWIDVSYFGVLAGCASSRGAVFTFLKDGRDPLTALGRKMAQKSDDAPHLVVLEDAFPAGHAAEANTIFDDPLQLPILNTAGHPCLLNPALGGHLAGKRNTGVMPIEAMANLTMMLKMPHSGLDHIQCIWRGVLPILTIDFHLLLTAMVFDVPTERQKP